jgi:TonB-linked SusC/RagA family outer membrane protein
MLKNQLINMKKSILLLVLQTCCLILLVSASSFTFAQTAPILKGVVLDEAGKKIENVTVTLTDRAGKTTQNVVTNTEGLFVFNDLVTNELYDLSFTHVGYEKYTINSYLIKPNDNNSLLIRLKAESKSLNEVVVVGYGTQRKRDLTGAVSSVKASDFKDQPAINVQSVLQGRVAGVAINSNSGSPGAPLKVRIRGANSINAGNDPLYVVDGVALSSIGIQDLNVNDIESVEVLKDASATAIYGSRGANGIIIITTKQGKNGKTLINFNSFTGISNLAKKYDLLDGPTYAKQANTIAGTEVFKDANNAVTTDWQDLIFRPTTLQNYQLSISDGSDRIKYFISGNYINQPGIVTNSNYKKYALRSNLRGKLGNKTELFLNLFISRANSKNNGNLTKGNSVSGSLAWGPAETPYDQNGVYRRYSVSSIWANPLMTVQEQDNRTFLTSALLNGSLKHDFTSWLNLTVNLGLDVNSAKSAYINNDWIVPNNPGSGQALSENHTFQNSNILTFQKDFNEDHHLKVLAIVEATSNSSNIFTARGSGLTTTTTGYNNLGLNTSQSISSGYANWAILSYVGRLDYAFKDKFLLNATYRADGSSKFQNNKWGYFPSVGVGYKISEEKFIKNIELIDELKVRGSWGRTGNQSINPYSSLGLLSGLQYSFGTTTLYQGYTLGNPKADLKWETTDQYDLGVDISMYKRRVNLSLDYYNKKTKDLLLQVPVALYDGGGVVFKNIGSVANKGFEATLEVTPVKSSSFEWHTAFTASVNKSKVLSLGKDSIIYRPIIGGGIVNTNIQVVKVGQPLSTFYLIPWTGIYQQDDAVLGYKAGDNRYTDVSGNNSIGYEDRRVAGTATPTFNFGFNNTVRYKSFDLNVFFQGATGNKIYNGVYASNAAPTSEIKYPTIRESSNYWTPANTSAEWANPASKTNRNFVESTRYLQDGAYLRLKNLAFSYLISKKVNKVADIRISLIGQNLFTLTKYKGYDPELSSSDIANDADGGMDFGAYPLTRTFTLGINATF